MSTDCDFSFICVVGGLARSSGAEERVAVSACVASSAMVDGVIVAITVPANESGVDGCRLVLSIRVFRVVAMALCGVGIWDAVELARIEGGRCVGGERRE